MVPAVQHERAPRPTTIATQHQLTLQKLGYHFSRPTLFPTSVPSLSSIPTYSNVPPPPPPDLHGAFLDSPFQDFSRVPDMMATDMSLLNSPIGSLGGLNPFKIPLFPTPLHYPIPHPGYFPSNIFYPSLMPADSAAISVEQIRSEFSTFHLILSFIKQLIVVWSKCLLIVLIRVDFISCLRHGVKLLFNYIVIANCLIFFRLNLSFLTYLQIDFRATFDGTRAAVGPARRPADPTRRGGPAAA